MKHEKHIYKFKNLFLYISIALFILSFIFLIIIFSQGSKIKSLVSENVFLKDDYKSAVNQLIDLNVQLIDLNVQLTTLQKKYLVLNKEFINLKSENSNQSSTIERLTSEYDILKQDLNNFREEINSSMDWFKINSTIDNISDSKRMKSHILKCIYCDEDKCYIKTTCINEFVNRKKFHLEYALDKDISNSDDHLQSLESFIQNERGDCEEWSLLFTAQLRYAIDYVINKKEKIPIIEAVIESNTNIDYEIYGDWYYSEGISKYLLDENYIYPYAVCGKIFDPNKLDYDGHCVVMITNKPITSEDKLDILDASYLIEPQFGDFIDRVKYNGVLITDDGTTYILDIITKNDYYQHESQLFLVDITSNNWYSYNFYLNRIDDFK